MSQENLIEEADSFFGAIKTKRHDLAATEKLSTLSSDNIRGSFAAILVCFALLECLFIVSKLFQPSSLFFGWWGPPLVSEWAPQSEHFQCPH